jgi:hypothetical protein
MPRPSTGSSESYIFGIESPGLTCALSIAEEVKFYLSN